MHQALLAAIFALLLAPAAGFDEAKADASKRVAYLEALLAPRVKAGEIKAWYYVADEKQLAAAQDEIKAQYKAAGREFYYTKEVKAIFAPLETKARRATVWYSDKVTAGNSSKAGVLLVGDVFALASEDEAKSAIEDFALSQANYMEKGLKVKDLELDANIPALKLISSRSLLPLYSQANQLEAILKGTRKVSEDFQKDVTAQYLATHTAFAKSFAQEKKVYDDNNENTLQKEIVDFLDECFKSDHERFEKLGLQHKLVSKETQEYTLEKK